MGLFLYSKPIERVLLVFLQAMLSDHTSTVHVYHKLKNLSGEKMVNQGILFLFIV